jgi:3-deoxy-manno-octulosonate cytidylyltransferase (CMP-KDO synthetase)
MEDASRMARPNLRLHSRSVIVIPARLASTRLPRKMLLRDTGKSMVQHTYEAACQATRPLKVLVATDHEEIARDVLSFGGDVHMTSPDLTSGTDRVAEVARRLPDADIIVNVQGDEPEMSPSAIDRVIELLEEHPEAGMSTVATPLRSKEMLDDPACVKVVFDGAGRAIYFSRSPIPHARTWDDSLLTADPPHFHLHMGLYAYRRDFLLNLTQLPVTELERLESLEQLRVLHAGLPIMVGVVDQASRGIDTPDDYQAFVRRRMAG